MSLSTKNINFYIKKPKGEHKSYGLVKYSLISRGKKEYIKLDEAETALLKSINVQFQTQVITASEAEARLKKYIDTHNKKKTALPCAILNVQISDYNTKIFNKFWNALYEPKELEDSSSAKYDFQRALRAIEPLAVDASAKELKTKLKPLPVKKLKRVYARLNEIRRYLGIIKKEESLSTILSEMDEVEFITIDELRSVLKKIENEDVKNAVATLFATGLRLGEMLALTKKDLLNGYLNIVKQRRSDDVIKKPKRNRVGKVIILNELKPYVLKFLDIEDKHLLRNAIYNTLVDVGENVLKRHIHPHMLRHSHAIHLLGLGASLTDIALQLRNRIEVCQKYYTGFAHTDDTLSRLQKLSKG